MSTSDSGRAAAMAIRAGLKAARVQSGQTLATVSKALETSVTTLAEWESDASRDVKLRHLLAWTECLGLAVDVRPAAGKTRRELHEELARVEAERNELRRLVRSKMKE